MRTRANHQVAVAMGMGSDAAGGPAIWAFASRTQRNQSTSTDIATPLPCTHLPHTQAPTGLLVTPAGHQVAVAVRVRDDPGGRPALGALTAAPAPAEVGEVLLREQVQLHEGLVRGVALQLGAACTGGM